MTENPQPQPPIARKDHKETVLHGAVLTDDYAWLRDKDNPDVTAYLEAEKRLRRSGHEGLSTACVTASTRRCSPT